jgi:hypothetical protein
MLFVLSFRGSLPTHTATERQHKQHQNTQENAPRDVEIRQ